MSQQAPHHIASISQLLKELRLPAPTHPLVSLVNYDEIVAGAPEKGKKISIDFYKISFKTRFNGRTKYGQGYYDFEEGGLAFLRPKQIVVTPEDLGQYTGIALYFHPDFIRNYALGTAIQRYGFFSYEVNEALFLSAKEKDVIARLLYNIGAELSNNIDAFTQDVLVSQIELLLNYSNRFYNRQFLTRKTVNNDIIARLNSILHSYFDAGNGLKGGFPKVQFITDELKCSQRYLSDMLRVHTGLNTQQFIQNAVVEKAKETLSTTDLSVGEIAHLLGFEHQQSFSKMFRQKTNQSPLEYRASFN
jgi:AraC-like DNA-binding protein